MTITKIIDTTLTAAGAATANATKTDFDATTKEFTLAIKLAGTQNTLGEVTLYYTCVHDVADADTIASTYTGFEKKSIKFPPIGKTQVENTKPLKVFGSSVVVFIGHPTKPNTVAIEVSLVELT
jgi:hypothetical protein